MDNRAWHEPIVNYVVSSILRKYPSDISGYRLERSILRNRIPCVRVFCQGDLLRVFLIETPSTVQRESAIVEWMHAAVSLNAVGARLWIATPLRHLHAVRALLKRFEIDAELYEYDLPELAAVRDA